MKLYFGLVIADSSITSSKELAASFISSQCDATLTLSFMHFLAPLSFKYLTLSSTDSVCHDITTCFFELMLAGDEILFNSDDALKAIDHGVDAIVVSNHGGRQLDGGRAPFDQLTEIVDLFRTALNLAKIHYSQIFRTGLFFVK